ncbi:MAG TPA: 3-deoxy-manno-octulosonate cytidylyltransferase [Candidatus Bathyarchaeia archaeon]|nr:3-deoxy-manno-octulosonate cytidylyltransferase [Candidatus Bathyarchaeia archaeon]
MSVVVIIPARYASTRLPGKALAEIAGKPMIAHVLARAQLVRGVDRVLVATDDERIADAVESAGGEAVMTRSDHPSGTDRVAEVARALSAEIVVNLQGDLPLLEPAHVEAALDCLNVAPAEPGELATPQMATLATPLGRDEVDRPQVVKVVRDVRGDALYFSRSPIPWGLPRENERGGDAVGLRHIGLYVYRRTFLLGLANLAPTPLERAERLEQLRVLEHGHRIRVAIVEAGESMIEVDTPEDLERVRALCEARPKTAAARRRVVARSDSRRERHG